MEPHSRYDNFEPGDETALVCVDDLEVQRVVVENLGEMGYKIHTGLFTEDITLKLKAQTYDVIIVYESFNDTVLEGNAVLAEITRIPAGQRRQQFVVLLGSSLITNDESQAFECSVDLTFCVCDLGNFAPVLRRGLTRHKEFYRLFSDCLRMAGS